MDYRDALVSCIIPTRNRPQMLVSAIGSVLGQTHKKTEIIVVDDSTNDETKNILSRSGLPIRYIKNDDSKGAPYSRNIGLSVATGDVMAFLDDDDLWFPHKIESQLSLLKEYQIVGCCYLRSNNGKKHYMKLPSVISYEEMLYFNYLGSCSFVITSREAISNCFFDESLASGQDWDMWINIMKNKGFRKIAIVQKYCVSYNCGPHSRISDPSKAMNQNFIIFKKYDNDHNAHSMLMFCLYNMFPTNHSLSAIVAKEFLKTRMKNKGIIFFISLLLNEIFLRRTTIY